MNCNCSLPPAVERSPERTVTLVHGTHAQHAAWMQPGKDLPDRLADLAGTALYRFCWRGRNRHGDRLEASVELRQHLSGLLRKFPKAKHYVVAHSHGGNVALHAVRDGKDAARQTEDTLSEEAPIATAVNRVRVATLGTPFLSMVARPFPTGILLGALLMFVIVVLFSVQFLMEQGTPGNLRYLLLLLNWAVMATSVLFSVVLFGWSLLAYHRGGTASSGCASSTSPARGSLWDLAAGKRVHVEADCVSSPAIAPDRLFVVRAQGDEAAGALGAAQLFAWVLESLLWRNRPRLLKGLAVTFGVLAVLAGVVLVLVHGSKGFAMWDSAAGQALYLASTGGIVGCTLLVLTYWPFGTDMLFWALFANVTAGPSPIGHGGKSYQAGRATLGGFPTKSTKIQA